MLRNELGKRKTMIKYIIKDTRILHEKSKSENTRAAHKSTYIIRETTGEEERTPQPLCIYKLLTLMMTHLFL